MQFCFTTIVNGHVFVDARVGNTYIPCGSLSSINGPESNSEYVFENDSDLCGATAAGYRMELPDTVYLEWGNAVDNSDTVYKKAIALPPFPPIDRKKERYSVGFCIGYQDCVYVRIDKVKKYY